ncbi:MAG: U32 family peptidase [Bacteroidales bacterium]|nr:U32 family peptidase [Bacteroidales bacterium]
MKKIELLAPAKNLESGIAAINYGADAVYIGSPKFGARAAAGNSLEDIKALTDYAHKFYSKVYVTLNTILFDDELEEAQKTIHQLYEIGADAVIIQDMGILEMDLPPIPLFASTQTNNYTADKVKFLEDIGIQRVILARELSLNQIKEIKSKTNVDLEFFVHGALCVSYSGQCYFSHAIEKGSANRGACAQACRAYYSLIDNKGEVIIKDKHLLSLKDLNLSDNIHDLLDAGVSSFKIEGRLKDIDYIKNITSYYRKKIDEALARRDGLKKSSSGKIYLDFTADPEKTFNRGYTDYFVNKRNKDIASPNTQKSIGKKIGKVKSIPENKNFFIIESKEKLDNGDGICFFDNQGRLQGTQVNKTDNNKIFPDNLRNIEIGTEIYRNFDINFTKQLSSSKTERKIFAIFSIVETEKGIAIQAFDEDNNQVYFEHELEKTIATNPERAFENIQKQFTKSGDSIFKITEVKTEFEQALFFPMSELNNLRRKALELLEIERVKNYSRESFQIEKTDIPYINEKVDYKENISNKLSKEFYKRHGIKDIENAFEIQSDFSNKEIMITKHCIKYQIGACEKFEKNPTKFSEPLFLEDNNRKYKLEFDCKNCQMKVLSPE